MRLACCEACGRIKAAALALDVEESIDALYGLEGDRGDLLGILALADVPFDIGQFEELAARM